MIRPLDRSEFSELYRKHIDHDFPPDEIPPEHIFLRMLDEDENLRGYVYSEDGEDFGADSARGYAFIRVQDGDAFLFLFAICDAYRGTGLGTRFMQELFDELKGCRYILLEAERPESAENDADRAVRERRLRFYEHLGYVADRSIDYEVYYVEMWLMTRDLAGKAPRGQDLAQAIRGFYSNAPGLPIRTEPFPTSN